MKNSYYFPHDYHARHDPKLERLRIVMGCEGIGIYWCLVEMLYEEGGSLRLSDIEIYAKALNTTAENIQKTLSDFNLFVKNKTHFYSTTLIKRLKHINTKREKASISAKLSHSANAGRTQSERSAIKERKGKERKGKEILKGKDREKAVSASEIKFALPEWIPKETWDAFIEVRKAKKCPNTERALNMLIKKLYKFKIQGIDIKEIIECSIVNGWKDIYEPRKGGFIQGRNKQEHLQDKNIEIMKNWLDKKMEVLE